MKESVAIGLVGTGGVGVVTIGEILEKIAKHNGYRGRLSMHYDSQIKGGGSAVKINIGWQKDAFPGDQLDILVCFSAEKYPEFEEELSVGKNTIVFFEDEGVATLFSQTNLIRVLFSRISEESVKMVQNKNLVALGLLLEFLGFSEEIPEEIVKSEKILSKENMPAVMAGRKEGKKFLPYELPNPAPDMTNEETIIMDGNRAVSEGALRAGCLFCAAYPITPDKIREYMSRKLPKRGGIFVQAEDEIAAACMVFGASLGGVKAMTDTSGPGFDLMMETINLGSSTETPMVVVDVQRVGPSTGIPTKTEQSDLSTAIFGGHGYAPRVVLAPYDLEGCYRLAIEAFNIAEELQVPVILLSDQYLGQTLQIVKDFRSNNYPIKNRLLPDEKDKGNYSRYKMTENFISPVSIPGMEGFEWRAMGLLHDEKGNPSSSADWHQKMQEKITKKLEPLRGREDLVKIFGPKEAKIGLISWGSSGEIALNVVKQMGLEKEIKVCIPELIAPMPKKIMSGFLKGLRKLLIVEMNYSGQYHGFLRRYFNLPKKTFLGVRAGGRPWSQKEIQKFIEEMMR